MIDGYIYSKPLLIWINWGKRSFRLSDNPINEAKGSSKTQKLRTQINGKFIDVVLMKLNKKILLHSLHLFINTRLRNCTHF
jgi:hypothetical protein